MMKCSRCKKHVEVVLLILWPKGPNGNRVYELCSTCAKVVEAEKERIVSETHVDNRA